MKIKSQQQDETTRAKKKKGKIEQFIPFQCTPQKIFWWFLPFASLETGILESKVYTGLSCGFLVWYAVIELSISYNVYPTSIYSVH
jgi:hypothetical protein